MPTFEYQAKDTEGKLVKGVVIGASLDQALQELTGKGFQITNIGKASSIGDPLAGMAAVPTSNRVPELASRMAVATETSFSQAHPPVEVPRREVPRQEISQTIPVETGVTVGENLIEGPSTEERSYAARAVWGPLVGTVPLTQLLFFFRQGATMFQAGVPIVQSINTLAGQAQNHKLKKILHETAGHVEAGRPISAGLQRYPEVFSPIMVSLVRSGEEGGFLDDSMKTVADYLEREIALQNLYKRVTFMPKLQIALSIIIVIATNLIIAAIRPGAPGLTSPLSEPKTWVILTPVIIAIFLFLRVGLANHTIKTITDTAVVRIPYVGKTVRQLSMARFGRAFGALFRGGVPMVKSLQLSADACGNEFLRGRMYTAVRGLEEGGGITETFRATQAFNPIVIDMVQTGETTGNLDFMLNKVAEYYEDEAATRATKTGQVVGVLLALAVAIYIGYVVISFYSGYYGGIAKEAG